LSSWINGNLTHAFAIIAGLVTGKLLETALTMSLDDIVATVADWLDAPWTIALWACYTIYDYINQIAQIAGYVSTAWWVWNTVVEQYSGDGWMWASPVVLVAGYWYCSNPYHYRNQLWERYFEVRSYNETWGTQGVEFSSPMRQEVTLVWEAQDITLDAPTEVWLPEHGANMRCP
jgi:hypothetical protein